MYILFGLHQAEFMNFLDNDEIDIGKGEDTVHLAKVLPPSIETLYISHTNGKIRLLTRALENLLAQKDCSTPKLRRIAFEAFLRGNEEKFDFSRLDRLAEDAGVRISKIDSTGEEEVKWRGQGMDGSLTWAAEMGVVTKNYLHQRGEVN